MVMKLDPIKYEAQKMHPVGVFFATMSPDGWTQTFYQPTMGDSLKPDELLEFIKLVTDFIRKIDTRDKLDDYSAHNGNVLTPGVLPTYGIMYDIGYIICDLHVTGCNTEFRAIRKEKK